MKKKKRLQQGLFDDKEELTPAKAWDQDAAKRALDELFSLTHQYKSSKEYHSLLQFTARFRFYSPYNAMLVHIQMPGARFVASAHRWNRDYERKIKAGARTLIMLQPMTPVMFVFDVSDTEGKPLPPEVENPFEVRHGKIGPKLGKTIENAQRDGVAVHTASLGSQQGGSLKTIRPVTESLMFGETRVPLRYALEFGENTSEESRYATLAHELAHLYCGHLGTPNKKWWPDRRGLAHNIREFEAESVSYMVCARQGIDTPSERYLADYVDAEDQVPPISLDCVMKAATLIETMGGMTLSPRKAEQGKGG
jgi:hypothetical protein